MILSFSELWEKCESYHKDNSTYDSVTDIINELIMKINLYLIIEQKSEISLDEIKKAKFRLIGEILLSLTALSLKDNINVFDALKVSLLQHSINYYNNKYNDLSE